jgi:hypothetical protein
MAFDPGSGRTLLFGGDTCFCSLSPSLGDTWSWDGTSWLEVGASGGPSPRSSALLASDPLRGEVLLFGGLADRAPKNELVHETFVETELRSDTWVWRRGRWERREPRHSPPPASAWGCGLAFDERRGRVLLLRMGHGEPAETWEWDGTDWQQACPGNAPRAATLDALVYDRAVGRVVARTWREDTSLTATWEWDGADWIERTASPRAAGRILHAMAWDSERKRLVLFGGAREERPVFPWSGRPWAMADTWEWDGAYWELRLPATSPPARAGHAMAWDSRRKRVVLFGGKDEGGVLLADTWEWDGTDWSVRPGPAPPARHLHAMAFDSRRARVVLFGGEGWFGAFGDTCEWDGDSWKVWTPRVGPGARLGHRLLELPSPGRLLVSKGRRWESDIGLSDAWEWDGSAWSRIERDDGRSAIARAFASDPPGGRRGAAVAFDAAGRALYLYGGIGPSGPVAELWRLDLP